MKQSLKPEIAFVDMYNCLSVNPSDGNAEYLKRITNSFRLKESVIFLLNFLDFYETENSIREITATEGMTLIDLEDETKLGVLRNKMNKVLIPSSLY